MSELVFAREELYEQVWATPMRKLAAAYGLSDVGLAKVCKKHQIPRPPVGYWAKKEFGKALPRPPLPRCDDPNLQAIRLAVGEPREPRLQPTPQEPAYDPEILEVLQRARGLPKVEVPTTLRNFHPLVRATRDKLEGTSAETHGPGNPYNDGQPRPMALPVLP
jgi:hypothetical protein